MSKQFMYANTSILSYQSLIVIVNHISTTHLPYRTDAAVFVSSQAGDGYGIS